MDRQHGATIARMHSSPPPTDLAWADIEAALRAAGVEIRPLSGSWVALVKGGELMVVRPPLDKPIAVRATVKDIAAFLDAVGVTG